LQKAFPLSGGGFSINLVTGINCILIQSHSSWNVSIRERKKLITKTAILHVIAAALTCKIFPAANLLQLLIAML
jgi:hypothetical protein